MERNTPVPSLVAATRQAAAHFKARQNNAKYRNDPVLWAKDKLGVNLWSLQAAVALSVAHHKKTAVKSGHGVGKSYLAAVLIMWWIDVHRGEDVQVITTAPTWSMVRGIVWEYVRKMHRQKAEEAKENEFVERFIGTINEQAEWRGDNRDIIAFGTKPADSSNTGFQGRHYDYTLVLIDEANGVTDGLFTSAEAVTTTDTCRIMVIGNPTDPNTPFGNIFLTNGGKGLEEWNKFTISSMDTPVFTGEPASKAALKSLTSKATVEGWRKKWGEDSNDWKSRVLGEFPSSSDDNMYPTPMLYKGIDTSIAPAEGARPKLGVDVSRFGTDKSAIVVNLGGVAIIEKVWTDPGDKSNDGFFVASIVHEVAVRLDACEVRIDVLGPGASVVDKLAELSIGYDYSVIEMNGSVAAKDNRKHLNARAEWHDNVRDLLVSGRISLPDTDTAEGQQLFDEMREIKKRYNKVHRNLQIESKDDMKSRGVKSPDISDALMYAFADLDLTGVTAGMNPGEMFTSDPWDMLSEMDENSLRGISPL